MIRNALRQSSRTVGAVAVTSRAAAVSSSMATYSYFHRLVPFLGIINAAIIFNYNPALWTYGTGCVANPQELQVRTSAPAAIISTTKHARSYAADAKASPTEVSSILEQRIRGVQEEAGLAETGRVLSVGYVC